MKNKFLALTLIALISGTVLTVVATCNQYPLFQLPATCPGCTTAKAAVGGYIFCVASSGNESCVLTPGSCGKTTVIEDQYSCSNGVDCDFGHIIWTTQFDSYRCQYTQGWCGG